MPKAQKVKFTRAKPNRNKKLNKRFNKLFYPNISEGSFPIPT